ncbi:MAG: YggT family protein [Gammaproteobacteria bacterium]|nr:MAG: YggT family protein [Gammaproteobacteria bacterium]RKZ43570.1 MAG: YggT family protein [Gammaproteobacteria bacterium]RKZ72569.1 MAG: YggT family protein [Gammaproteobacteria bacterium]
MVISPFTQALVFLVTTVFSIYILLLMLRFLLQWLRVAFRRDPLLQLLLKMTDPPLRLLYNFIPGWHDIDFAAIVLMLILKMVELSLITWLYGQHLGITGLLLLSMAELLSLLIYIFIFAILIQALLSWITPAGSYNPFHDILYHLNEPLLRPVRYKMPQMQGLDFSPLIVIIALKLAEILLVDGLRYLAQ